VSNENTAFGFRGGFIGLYNISNSFGIFADLCGEAYSDNFNGLQPSEAYQVFHRASGIPGRVSPAGGVGFLLPIKLTSRVFLTPDFKATFLSANAFADGSRRIGTNLSATLGVTVLIGN
jgi:hypothetical protein